MADTMQYTSNDYTLATSVQHQGLAAAPPNTIVQLMHPESQMLAVACAHDFACQAFSSRFHSCTPECTRRHPSSNRLLVRPRLTRDGSCRRDCDLDAPTWQHWPHMALLPSCDVMRVKERHQGVLSADYGRPRQNRISLRRNVHGRAAGSGG